VRAIVENAANVSIAVIGRPASIAAIARRVPTGAGDMNEADARIFLREAIVRRAMTGTDSRR
jgi:hypothetical protein